ncbi:MULTISPECIES: sensor histidine kinase [unclassified Paenibacillus]|uniref:sensor histidine kinase n=1 Tax=unclassified Paenibacillus TaxID=185978 RepID=UPI0009A8E719|nr:MULTISPECIES: HAMP domain-containing sensor histidine kinase [unclassified Paenibacillus]SLK05715.1 Signal transduction histidine kinase [Paenibacillus sp. RU5A]SOC70277.1 Signal transduction histidine kinase [Paenibacillus sp. RU26A]SOC72439.1 Signal transduction histidine kinase [Paenibacillus sp. RU5M]
MRISIKLKFSVFLAALLILTVVVLSSLVLRGIERNQQTQIETILSQQTRLVNLNVRQSYYTESVRLEQEVFLQQNGRRLAQELASSTGLPIALYDMKGQQVGSSIMSEESADITATLNYALQNKIAYHEQGDTLLYVAPLDGPDGQMGAVRMQYPVQSYHEFYARILQLFMWAGIAVVGLSFILGYLFYNRFAVAITRLKKSADSIREGHYITESPVSRKDELGELGQGIYYMSTSIQQNIEAMHAEQQKLQLAIEKLQALEQQQKQYIGNISHEFKTPLTSIKAYVELLDMYKDDPQLLDDATSNIGKETERLYEMVEKVLHLSALEKYDFENQAEDVEVRALLEDACGRMRGKAEKFALNMELTLLPAVIRSDRESLMHIFINLLDNAIKYNVPGGVIRVSNELRMQERQAVIRIFNSGTPIPDEASEKIFEPFYTVNKDRARKTGGTGLGLSLVKQFVEKQGGTISLLPGDPKHGEGTTFQLVFPLAHSSLQVGNKSE